MSTRDTIHILFTLRMWEIRLELVSESIARSIRSVCYLNTLSPYSG